MSIVSKTQTSSLSHEEIERLVQKGRIERSRAFRGFLSSVTAGERDGAFGGELNTATARS